MNCKYCNEPENKVTASCLVCIVCQNAVHISCLKRKGTPGSIPGDIFFQLTCSECSPINEEILKRESISWFQTIVLAFYDWMNQSSGTDRDGYYHWKYHIGHYIDRNWKNLFKGEFKKKKNWIGTVSGTMSLYSPLFFKSGTSVFNELGWWRLTHPYLNPELVSILQSEFVQEKSKLKEKRKKQVNRLETNETELYANIFEELLTNLKNKYGIESGPVVEPPLKKMKVEESNASSSTAQSSSQSSLKDFTDCILDSTPTEDVDESLFEILPFENTISFVPNDFEPFSDYVDVLNGDITPEEQTRSGNISRRSSFEFDSQDDSKSVESDEQVYIKELLLEKSLFKVSEKKCTKDPWEEDEGSLSSEENVLPMTTYEETQLLRKIEPMKSELPPHLYRFYAKLRLRDQKRKLNIPLFNVDEMVHQLSSDAASSLKKYSKNRLLDRFQKPTVLLSGPTNSNKDTSFTSRILGHVEYSVFHSPYTNRQLKPFIRRDYETKPLWLQLMNELKLKVSRKVDPNYQLENAPIDYCYVRPHHISAINSLCELFFWPGIDMTEALEYPDFTCVVLYKKLIIGFAFLIPDVNYNESYISFIFTRPEWRRSGIATFMLYHLVQTCMGKDITLHVSATNPAVILYQKFNFKVEEFIQDFYDKYMPLDNHDCKHALFLRLSR